MDDVKIVISPKSKLGELLNAYPLLEELLLNMSPAFKKLKNPILRKTVARVATLQQVAIIGGMKVDELVNRLREEAGQGAYLGKMDEVSILNTSPPLWFEESKVTSHFDATSLINTGSSPMSEILKLASSLKPGDILEISSPFVPAPILEMFKTKGFPVFSKKKGNLILSYIKKV